MSRYLLACLLAISIVGLTSANAAPIPFAEGQVWSYETRKAEPDSRLVILRVYQSPDGDKFIFVGVLGLTIQFTPSQPPVLWEQCYMPFPESVLRKSVTKLEKEHGEITFPAFEKIYPDWKKKADAGHKQLWTTPVAKAIDSLEEMIRKNPKQ